MNTQAEIYEDLYQSGSKKQAIKICESMSLSYVIDLKNRANVYIFEDGSGIYISETEFRVAAESEK